MMARCLIRYFLEDTIRPRILLPNLQIAREHDLVDAVRHERVRHVQVRLHDARHGAVMLRAADRHGLVTVLRHLVDGAALLGGDRVPLLDLPDAIDGHDAVEHDEVRKLDPLDLRVVTECGNGLVVGNEHGHRLLGVGAHVRRHICKAKETKGGDRDTSYHLNMQRALSERVVVASSALPCEISNGNHRNGPQSVRKKVV